MRYYLIPAVRSRRTGEIATGTWHGDAASKFLEGAPLDDGYVVDGRFLTRAEAEKLSGICTIVRSVHSSDDVQVTTCNSTR